MTRASDMLKLAAQMGYETAIKEAGMPNALKYLLPGAAGFALGALLINGIDGDEISSNTDKVRETVGAPPPPSAMSLTQGMFPDLAQQLEYLQNQGT